jgi:hypothetical protein
MIAHADSSALLRRLASRRALMLLTALAIAFVGMIPVVAPPLWRGRAWQGSLPYVETDELAYAAYVRALADGRTRLSDPYSGRDDTANEPHAETFFSVQFVPAYALATLAHALHLSASAVFALATLVVAIASALVLFKLVEDVTDDPRVAAAGTLAVLCLSMLPTSNGLIYYLLRRTQLLYPYLPFLRRYVPALAFPLYLAFIALVWRALTTEKRRDATRCAALAGLVFAVLVYTYFFLWTSALAWLASLACVWLLARPKEWRALLKPLALISIPAAMSLAPYFYLLTKRAAQLDASHFLVNTRAPMLLRPPELLGFLVLIALAFAARRGMISFKGRAAIFAATCALMPCVVFNQQLLTGRTLQPIHYEMYSANFTAMLAAVVALDLMRRALPRLTPRVYARALLVCSAITVAAAVAGSLWTARRMIPVFTKEDALYPAARRLAELARTTHADASGADAGASLDTRSVVFIPDKNLSDALPTVAPQPVLWSLHLFVFTGVTEAEERERLAQFLYYSGVSFADMDDTRELRSLDDQRRADLMLLIGLARANRNLNPDWKPPTRDDYDAAMRAHDDYAASFTRERAARTPVSYLLMSARWGNALPNFDRFYERDAGERVGDFILYRVKLRQ